MKRTDAFGGREIVHGFLSREWRPEQMTVGARFDLHRLLDRGLVEHLDCVNAAVGDALDLGRPARRHIAGLDPVVDDGAVQMEGAGDFGLTTEDFYEAGGAIHAPKISCQDYLDKICLTNQGER